MQRFGETRHVLVSVNFGRTKCQQGAHPLVMRYDMVKLTPFGLLQSDRTVLYTEYIRYGQAVMDGRMFSELSTALHLEEQRRLLEGGATVLFGEKVA